MKILQNPLQDAFVIEAEPYFDNRGKFSRLFCQNDLKEIGHYKNIVQINHSLSRKKGSIRGMHFQHPPKAEVKIVICLSGSVFDVFVDLRHNSASFLRWYGEVLSVENQKMMYIPEGCAHGFQTLEDDVELLYLHTEFYSPEHEGGVHFNDPLIGIPWPLEITEISEKDNNYPLLTEGFKGIQL